MLFGYFCCPSTTYYNVAVPGECIFHFSYVFRYVRTKQVSPMNICYMSHEGHPLNEKNSKIEDSKNSVSKNIGCICYCF